jgi:SAM-dependent methyltransferase
MRKSQIVERELLKLRIFQVTPEHRNIDEQVVKDFGSEWSRFDQSKLSQSDHQGMFESYFHIFPWEVLPFDSVGADVGCGSGRWAALVAPKVGHLHLLDPSAEALAVAKQNLSKSDNSTFHQSSVDSLPFNDSSLDFAYALGVLHHVPDTGAAVKSIARILKPGAPFLVYLYYAFDQRPWWFRALWRVSDIIRRGISALPDGAKNVCCDVIALAVYLPLSRMAWLLERLGILPNSWPLSYYRDRDFYVLRTDALDRFGTRLEQRFSRAEIQKMLEAAGFESVRFSNAQPFWCAVGFKKQ